VPSSNPTFVTRTFTPLEIEYCHAQPSPPLSFTVQWVGKEAIFKSLGVKSKGAAAAILDIEILNDENGTPVVNLHGDAKTASLRRGMLLCVCFIEGFNSFFTGEEELRSRGMGH
jgi:fatty acid synthase subunit beta